AQAVRVVRDEGRHGEQERLELPREGRTADGAGGGADHGDADLDRGEEALGIFAERLHGARALLALLREPLERQLVDPDDGDLRGGEQPVDEDEREDDRELEDHGRRGLTVDDEAEPSSWGFVRARDGKGSARNSRANLNE